MEVYRELRYISRSSHEDFSECPRRGFYRYLYKGAGVEAAAPSIPLSIGLSVHKGLEGLMNGLDIGRAVRDGLAEWDRIWSRHETDDPRLIFQQEESQALVEGLLRGWHRCVYPGFMEEFEILCVEKPIRTLLASNVTLMARADVVVRSRLDGRIYVINWKTTKDKANWTAQWEDEMQPQTEALAVEADLEEPVAGVIFMGLYKGRWSDGVQASPLIYKFVKDGLARSSYLAGWRRAAAWRDEGIEKWVGWLPEAQLEEQFVASAPILKDNDLVQGWIEEIVRKETDAEHVILAGSERDQLLHFWRNFSKQNCKWCIFRKVCKGQTTVEDLLESGYLMERIDHHGQQKGVEDVSVQ